MAHPRNGYEQYIDRHADGGGAGSCAGGIARYLAGKVTQVASHTTFPWGTLLVNIMGCFLMGLVYGLIDRGFQLSDHVRLFITVGFCFMNGNYLLLTGSQHLAVALYVLTSTLGGFLMVYLAYRLTRL